MTALVLVLSAGFSTLALLAAIADLVGHRWGAAFDPARQAVGGFVGIGVVLWLWRRHGFLSVVEKTSVEGYALSRAIEDWNTARDTLARAVTAAYHAADDLDDTAADRARSRMRAAREHEQAARERVHAALVALHEKFPDDPSLTEDLHALFPG